ncbi:hypothetical protein [Campylobacter sp. RM16188]|uniref:hypothetical protein n=1 Tax=Campylobacter sp. RM16188 TaxID=1705725 RepID=UPI001551FBEA|nr:hypothetical protein [Campylobacter sp. RM16188]
MSRKGAYSEVESLKKGKYEISRDYRRTELLFAVGFTIIIMVFFSGKLISKDLFVFSPADYFGKDYKGDFNYVVFLISIFSCLFVAWLFVGAKSLEKHRDKLWFKILNLPFWLFKLFFYIPKDLEHTIGFEACYLRKLEKKFFYQEIKKEDGYSRVKELSIFYDRKYLFGKEYESILRLFRSKEHFDDLFFIIEGYLTKSKLYDTVIYRQNDDIFPTEYIQQHNAKIEQKGGKEEEKISKNRDYKYFQSYMLRKNQNGILEDNVTLSLNAIRIYMDDKKRKFRKFLEEEAFEFNRACTNPKMEFAKRFYALAQDVHFREKIIQFLDREEGKRVLSLLDDMSSKSRARTKRIRGQGIPKVAIFNDKKTMGYIIDMLMADFTLVLFRMVIGQFMNLPAGTIVVKLESYDTRMIIEYYKQFSTIEIVEKKNDGQSRLFQSDNYANLFFILFARFVDDKQNNVFSELYFRFNTAEYTKPLTFDEIEELIDSRGIETAMDVVDKINEEHKAGLQHTNTAEDARASYLQDLQA